MRRYITVFLGLIFSAAQVFGQIPDKFTNLQVLPKDIGKRELIDKMKSFCNGLGVRCEYCHLGEEGKPLETFDFVSDTKAAKRTARVMLQMVAAINDEHLVKVADKSTPPIQANCVTCHHGQSRPRALEEILAATISRQGTQAGIDKYRELRQKYYGGFTFDFGERTLNNLAQQLQAGGKNDEAIAILKLNAELYANSWMVYFQLAEIYSTKGDKILAMENYKKSLALNPENPPAKKKLEDLTKQP
jgi:tetratricopeptide (TPR) repeat protein